MSISKNAFESGIDKHSLQRRAEKFARPINGMLRLNYKCRFDAIHIEFDLARRRTRMIAKRFTAHMSIGGISPRKTNAATIGRTLSQLRRAPPCAAGELCMKGWSADELAELRAAFAGFGMSAESIDAHLHVLDNIATSWAEQAHGLSSISLTLSQRANYSFAGIDASATVQKSRKVKRVASAEKAVTRTSQPKGPALP